MMGEEISIDDLPATDAVELKDYFAPVMLSPHALDVASRIVPQKYFAIEGIHTFLSKRANLVFQKMPTSAKGGRYLGLEYHFDYAASGPVLKTVKLAPPKEEKKV